MSWMRWSRGSPETGRQHSGTGNQEEEVEMSTSKWWKLEKDEEFREELRQALGGIEELPDDSGAMAEGGIYVSSEQTEEHWRRGGGMKNYGKEFEGRGLKRKRGSGLSLSKIVSDDLGE